MLHYRSKDEISELPLWTHPRIEFQAAPVGGVKRKMGDLPGLQGALDIGSCYNIVKIRVDIWFHHWRRPSGFFSYEEIIKDHVYKEWDRGHFALLSPIFDYPVLNHSFGRDPVKTYTDEAARLADLTLTDEQVGFPFKQTNPVLTYWILLRPKTAAAEGLWEQLKEPLPGKKAALFTAFSGGINVNGVPYLPTALFLGTSRVAGKFIDAADPNFPTFLQQNMVPIGGDSLTEYSPPVIPAPGDVLAQLWHTISVNGNPRELIRFTRALPRYKRTDIGALLGFGDLDGRFDRSPTRLYYPTGHIPAGPFDLPTESHNSSWFDPTHVHSWPSSNHGFPLSFEANDGTPYYYTAGTINAGEEVEYGDTAPGDVFFPPDLFADPNEYINYWLAVKLDMGQVAQEDQEEYPPPDPARYIRELNAMK